jgi:hypothetical protein
MKRTKPLQYRKWIINNYISIIMLPCTFLILFISVYSKVIFDEESFDNFNNKVDWKNLKSLKDFFQNQKELSLTNIAELTLISDTVVYNQVFLLDRTISTEISTESYKQFVNFEMKHLNKSFPNIKKPEVIRSIFFLKFYEKFLTENNQFNFYNIFYDNTSLKTMLNN